MESNAQLRYLHIAPRKVRLVADVIRGMDVKRADLELANLPKRSSLPLQKLLKSAIQNAAHDFQQGPELLYIKKITVDGGPVMKRMRPRAFGRGAQILKRMSHVNMILGVRGQESEIMKTRKKADMVVREAESEDIKGDVSTNKTRKTERTSQATGGKARTGGFAKKIFPRKVI